MKSTDLTGVVIWCYQVEGAEFIGLNAPGLSTTWVYNLATQKWLEQAMLVDGEWAHWPADQITFFADQHFVASGAQFYVLDSTLDTIGSESIVYERTWPHLLTGSMEPVSYLGLEVSMTTGGKDGNGAITLELSKDGGSVWLPPLRRSLGAIGSRMEVVRWLGLGSAKNMCFRLRWSDAGPSTVYSAAVDA